MRRKARTLTTALLATVLGGALTLGMATGSAGAATRTDQPSTDRTAVDFRGIVKLSNCSGSVFRFADSADDAQALVLTNGHCVDGMPEPGEVITNEPSTRTFQLLNAAGDDTLGTLTADLLTYATMTDTDAAVYRVEETYAELRSEYDTEALTLSQTHPTAGTDIKVVSGYWEEIYSCGIDGFVPQLKEDGYVAKDSIRYTPGCDTIGGTSGSPVIDAASNEIVGVNNTAYEDTGADCSLDNPCEVDEAGNVTVVPDARYGQQTYHLRDCLNPAGKARGRAACELAA